MKIDHPAIEHDDGERGGEGLVASLLDLGNGKSRLIFDDVLVGEARNQGRVWKHRAFYTWAQFENRNLDEMSLADEDYQRIGEALVARLLAIKGRVK